MNTSLQHNEGKSFIETLNILFALMCVPCLFLALHTIHLFADSTDERGVFLWGMLVSILAYPIVAVVSIVFSRRYCRSGQLQSAKLWSMTPFVAMAIFAFFLALHHG